MTGLNFKHFARGLAPEKYFGLILFCLAMGMYTPSLLKYGNSIMTLNAVWHAVYNYLALKRNGEFLDQTKNFSLTRD